MAASLNDILVAAQNLIGAVNNLASAYLNVSGAQSTSQIAAAAVLKTAAGRVAQVSVTVAGSVPGFVYDANQITGASNILYTIPNVVGVYAVNMPANVGIVVSPGTGQTVTVSWS